MYKLLKNPETNNPLDQKRFNTAYTLLAIEVVILLLGGVFMLIWVVPLLTAICLVLIDFRLTTRIKKGQTISNRILLFRVLLASVNMLSSIAFISILFGLCSIDSRCTGSSLLSLVGPFVVATITGIVAVGLLDQQYRKKPAEADPNIIHRDLVDPGSIYPTATKGKLSE